MIQNKTYLFLFIVIFAIWALSEILGPVRWGKARLERNQADERDKKSLLIAFTIGIPSVIAAVTIPFFATTTLPESTFFIGIGIVILGIIWRWYAIRTLGAYFTAQLIVSNEQPIIQHGPYRLIRHPSYTGVLIIMFGFGLMIGNWISIIVLEAGLLTLLLYRIQIEERVLLQYTSHYAEYKHRTKRLIPFIY